MSMLTVMLASMAGLTLTSAPAADDVIETRQTINYASEQLLTDDGVMRLRQQIARTARSVCNDDATRHTRFSRETRQCIDAAYAEGLQQLEVKIAEARSSSRTFAQATAIEGAAH